MKRFLLSLFHPFRSFIQASGADYEQFIRIVELKLTLDDRKQNLKNNSGKEQSLILQSLSQIVLGFVFSLVSMIIIDEFTFYFVMHTIIMVMLAMMIISEFSTILFDTSENSIIQPLPIKGNTLSMARNAHVLLYLLFIAFNISVATFIIGVVKFGFISGSLFLFSVFMNVVFTLFLANILYLGLMKITSGEQLKTVLMYFQIAIAVIFMAAYQFGLNMIDRSNIANMILHVDWFTYFIPSAVFAGFISAFSSPAFNISQILFVLEAIIIPIVAVYLTSRYLTPIFNRKLLLLENSDRATKVKISSGKSSIYYRLMEMLHARTIEEKASFQLAWRMSGYERLFKQSFFPSIAYTLILVAVQFFKKDIDITEIVDSKRYLTMLYLLIVVSFTLTNTIRLGTSQHAYWVFKTLPVNSPALFFKGFIKAVYARFFNPIFLILSIIIVSVWGISVIPDVIIAWLANYFCTLLMFYTQKPEFPFTQSKATNQGGVYMIKVFGIMIMAALLGWMHYGFIQLEVVGYIILIFLYVACIYLINNYLPFKMISWKKINLEE